MASTKNYRHLDAETLAKLSNLKLRVRSVVDGAMAGLHRSPHRGASVEFAEHKEYAPGDDLRRLDWKALARFDRYYIRQFEDETELKAYLLLDCSGSMGYGAPLSKLEYASVLLGSLAYLLSRQRDQPSLIAFSDQVRSYVPPRSRLTHVAALLGALERLEPRGPTSFDRAIERVLEVVGRRCMVAIFSDMFDEGQGGLKLLRQLRARGHQVVVFHVLHRDEIAFPFEQQTLFEAMEDPRKVLVDPAGMRRTYVQAIEDFCGRVQEGCREAEVAYHRVTTADRLDGVLLKLLGGRPHG